LQKHAIVMSKQFDCSEVCYHSATQRSPQFGDSFPEKLLNIVAIRGEIFSLKFTKYRLAAELRPHSLGELKRSPDPLAAIRGPTSKGRGGEGKWEGEGKRGGGRRGEGEEEGEGGEGRKG